MGRGTGKRGGGCRRKGTGSRNSPKYVGKGKKPGRNDKKMRNVYDEVFLMRAVTEFKLKAKALDDPEDQTNLNAILKEVTENHIHYDFLLLVFSLNLILQKISNSILPLTQSGVKRYLKIRGKTLFEKRHVIRRNVFLSPGPPRVSEKNFFYFSRVRNNIFELM